MPKPQLTREREKTTIKAMTHSVDAPKKSESQIRDLIDEICRDIGPRLAGSDAEAASGRLLRDRLTDLGLEARIESFLFAPGSLHGFIGLTTIGLNLAVPLYLLSPWLSFGLTSLIITLALLARVFNIEALGAVLPKKWSWNIIGRLEPREETRQLLIFSGHHDSAYNMPLLGHPKLYPLLTAMIVWVVLALLALAGLSFYRICFSGTGGFALLDLFVLPFAGVGGLLMIILSAGMIRSSGVPGANDNLSAIAVVWELARRLSQDRPRHTEVWTIAFGAEEPGLKGSRDFVSRHRDLLQSATMINLESLGQSGVLYVLTGELMACTRHSEKAVSLVQQAAVEASERVEKKLLIPGLTDAASASRKGIEATTLIRFNDRGAMDYYHVPEDNPDHIKEENLSEAAKICEALVRLVDDQ